MAKSNRAYPLELRSVDMSEIAADTWTAFSVGPYEHPVFMMRIRNTSNAGVFISFDGVDRHEYLPGDQSIEINFQTNASTDGYKSLIPKGTTLYVQGDASQGNYVFFDAFYNQTS